VDGALVYGVWFIPRDEPQPDGEPERPVVAGLRLNPQRCAAARPLDGNKVTISHVAGYLEIVAASTPCPRPADEQVATATAEQQGGAGAAH
jgi:hypothetical protein